MIEPISFMSEEWYSELVEELKGMRESFLDNKSEIVMQSKWVMGEMIRKQNNPYGIQKQLAQDLHIAERTVGYAVQFYDDYPETNWDTAYSKIISNLASNGCRPSWSGWLKLKKIGAVNDCQHDVKEDIRYRCIKCGKVWRNKPQGIDK